MILVICQVFFAIRNSISNIRLHLNQCYQIWTPYQDPGKCFWPLARQKVKLFIFKCYINGFFTRNGEKCVVLQNLKLKVQICDPVWHQAASRILQVKLKAYITYNMNFFIFILASSFILYISSRILQFTWSLPPQHFGPQILETTISIINFLSFHVKKTLM